MQLWILLRLNSDLVYYIRFGKIKGQNILVYNVTLYNLENVIFCLMSVRNKRKFFSCWELQMMCVFFSFKKRIVSVVKFCSCYFTDSL